MNDARKKCSSPPEETRDQTGRDQTGRGQTGRLRVTQNKSKINRLKRSPKTNHTQKPDFTSSNPQPDFKTPTRVPKVGFRSSAPDESPNNDSELQHEIIWDPTSPATPVRNGRGRRRTAVFKSVDISDIVNRIAPKNKRPEEMESSLLRWIGDTAVPCTPEIREPRTKPKAARQNPVEDLLKLARQFDFNMIQQEEAHLRTNPQRSEEAQSEARDPFDPAPASPQARCGAKPPDDPFLIQETEDDLDLLFEGSTQQVSGGLSPAFSAGSEDVAKFTPQCRAGLGDTARSDSENECGRARVGGASDSRTLKQVGVADDFDDDWNDDDLLDDSLVMEMTQNPELFSAPQSSSTQKRAIQNAGSANCVKEAQTFHQRGSSFQHGQHWNKPTGNGNAWQSGFHAKSNPGTPGCPISKAPSIVPGSSNVSNSNPHPKKPMEIQQPLATTSADSSMWKGHPTRSRSVPLDAIAATPTFRIAEETKKHTTTEDDVLGDLAAEDLDSIFASDDIWDDGADDDDLFCQACETVEGSMAEPEPPPKAPVSKPAPQTRRNTAGKHGSGFVQPSPGDAGLHHRSSAAGNRAPSSTKVLPAARHNNTSTPDNSRTQSCDRTYKFSHVKSTAGTGSATCNTARQLVESATATTVQSYQRIQDQRQFKKPHSTFNAAPAVSSDVSTVVVTRCSDAEIERKKQQAMERRRLRMLANQNLQAPV